MIGIGFTVQEKTALIEGYAAYFGRYEVDEDRRAPPPCRERQLLLIGLPGELKIQGRCDKHSAGAHRDCESVSNSIFIEV